MSLFDKLDELGVVSKDYFSIVVNPSQYGLIKVDDDGNGDYGLKIQLFDFNKFLEAIPILEKADKRLGDLKGYRVILPENFETPPITVEFPVPNFKDVYRGEKIEVGGLIDLPGPSSFKLIKDGDESTAVTLSVEYGSRPQIGEHCLLVLEDKFEFEDTTAYYGRPSVVQLTCYKEVTIHVID